MLEQRGNVRVRVFAIWEPILLTDSAPPIGLVLRRMPDVRVQQYWDPNHLVAKQLAADARPPQPAQECCFDAGFLWDLVAVYPAGVRWNGRMPPATIFNGPVVDVVDALDAAIVQR